MAGHMRTRAYWAPDGWEYVPLPAGFQPVVVHHRPHFDEVWSAPGESGWYFCGPAAPLPMPAQRIGPERKSESLFFTLYVSLPDGRIWTYTNALAVEYVQEIGEEQAWRKIERWSAMQMEVKGA